jgi:hypothetical protein
MTLPYSQVTLYGAGKNAVQFHVAHDGKVSNGWWHVINVRVDAAGKVTLEDVTPFEYFDIQSEGGSTAALTYGRAAQLCSSQGQRLCSAAELCPGGRPRAGLDVFGQTDNWIAVNNAPNEWVTFNRAGNRLCKTHTQVAGSTPAWGTQANARGQGFTRAAECCF